MHSRVHIRCTFRVRCSQSMITTSGELDRGVRSLGNRADREQRKEKERGGGERDRHSGPSSARATPSYVDYLEHRLRERFLRAEEVSRNFPAEVRLHWVCPILSRSVRVQPLRDSPPTGRRKKRQQRRRRSCRGGFPPLFSLGIAPGSLVPRARSMSFPHKTFIYSNDREAFHDFSED